MTIIHTISIHRFNRRSRKSLGGSASETEEPEYTWEWGVWSWGGCGCVWYSPAVRYTIAIWSRKIRHKDFGGWSTQKTKGPECKWEGHDFKAFFVLRTTDKSRAKGNKSIHTAGIEPGKTVWEDVVDLGFCVFIFNRIKKGEGQRKESVTLKLWWSQKPMKG